MTDYTKFAVFIILTYNNEYEKEIGLGFYGIAVICSM